MTVTGDICALGFDFGLRHIGVAVAQTVTRLEREGRARDVHRTTRGAKKG